MELPLDIGAGNADTVMDMAKRSIAAPSCILKELA
jgi:hypothetical protein